MVEFSGNVPSDGSVDVDAETIAVTNPLTTSGNLVFTADTLNLGQP